MRAGWAGECAASIQGLQTARTHPRLQQRGPRLPMGTPGLSLEGPYRPSSEPLEEARRSRIQGAGASLLSSRSQPAGASSHPGPWPMLQGVLESLQRAPSGPSWGWEECPWEDVPSKSPTEMGDAGRGQGCATAESWEATAQTESTCCFAPHPTPALSNLGYSCADSVLS